MAKSPNSSALSALLGLESEDDAGKEPAAAAPRLPALDERVEMFLRAIHGPGRAFSAEERKFARVRLLDAMAEDLPAAMVSEASARSEKTTEFQSSPLRPRASSASAPIGQVFEPIKRSLQGALEFGAGLLRDAVLAPFALVPAAGGMRFAAASLVPLFVAGAGWSGAWLYSARSMERTFVAWTGSEVAAGRVYECGSRSVGGYPFRIEVHCIDPQMKVNVAQATYVLKAKEIVSTAQVLRPGTLTADVVGPLAMAALDEPVTLVGNWTSAQVSLRGLPTTPEQISAVVAGLKVNRITGGNTETIAAAEHIEFDAGQSASSRNPVYEIAAKIDGGSVDGPIAIRPFSAQVAALLHGAGDLTSKSITAGLKDWQAGGGQFELRNARVQQEDAVAVAQGNIGLATNGELAGALRVITTKTGAEHIAQSVVGSGNADRVQQFAQQIGNSPNAQPSDVDNAAAPLATAEFKGKETVDVPIRFSGGEVFIGPNAVSRIPPLF